MTLPKTILDFLNNNAHEAQVARPEVGDDLFKTGVLNSITLVELVSVLEEECEIKIPDEDVNATNFQSITAIEHYVESLKS